MELAELRTKAAELQELASRILQKNITEPNRDKWPEQDKKDYESHIEKFRQADTEYRTQSKHEEEADELSRGRDYYLGNRDNGKPKDADTKEDLAEVAKRDHMAAFEAVARRQPEVALAIIANSKAEEFEVYGGKKPVRVNKRTLMSGIDSAGGFANAPAEFIAQLQKDLVAASPIIGKCRMYNINSNLLTLPGLVSSTVDPKIWPSKFVGQWVNEEDRGAYGTATFPTAQGGAGYFEQINIPVGIYEPKPIALTETLLEDTAIDMSGELSSVLTENSAPDMENAILTGDGLNRKPKGILTELSGVTGFFTLSGTSGVIDYPGLVNLNAALAPQYHPGSEFVMNQASMAVVQLLSVSAGHYLVQPFNMVPSMFAKPITISNHMPSQATTAYPVLLGNFDGYALVQQRAFSVRFYDQMAPYMRIITARWRIGGAIRRRQYFRLLKSHNS